ADPVERAQRPAAGQHVVFADDLEPVDRRIAAQDLVVMLVAQAEAEAEEGRLGRCRRTVCKRGRRSVWQSAGDVHLVSARTGQPNKACPKLCRQPSMNARPGLHRAPIGPSLGRHVLTLGGVALFLGHGREALALAGVLALAGICPALACALALAGIGADALTFAGSG